MRLTFGYRKKYALSLISSGEGTARSAVSEQINSYWLVQRRAGSTNIVEALNVCMQNAGSQRVRVYAEYNSGRMIHA